MPGPVAREPFQKKLKTGIEKIDPAGIELAAFRTAAQEAFQGDGPAAVETKFFEDTASTAELQVLLDRVKQEGLSPEDVKAVLLEVRRHISVGAHFDATREHENKRTKAGWNIFKQIALNLKDAATLFGGGVADDVRAREATVRGDAAQVKALFEGAMELGIMRRRMKRYIELGGGAGSNLATAVNALKSGEVFAHKLLDVTTPLGQKYDLGLDQIISALPIEVGAGKMFSVDGLGDIEVPDEPTKKAIQHHLKFVLRTEIIKLVEAEQLTVLSSEEYNITHPQTTAQKAWQAGKGIVSSGTFWGMATRTGGRLAFGGALTAAGLTGGTAILGGMVIGAGFGVAAAYVRETKDARKRLTRRKLEAALGAVNDEMVKPASVLNQELKAGVKALQDAPNEAAKISALKHAFKAASDAQQRLQQARLDKQDYISFGVENRFQAQKQLLDNIEKALAAISKAMEELGAAKTASLRGELDTINGDNSTVLVAAKEGFQDTVSADETRRKRRAMMIGGVAGGFGSLVARYALDAWQGTGAAETAAVHTTVTTPAAEAAAGAVPDAASAAEHIAGSEPITAAGKSLFFTKGADHYMLALHDGKLDVHKFLPDSGHPSSDIQFSRTLALPGFQGDALQALQTPDGVRLFDAAGHPVGEVAFGADAVSPAGSVTEQIFADPEASKLLDAMGLQKGELVYDPQTKLFHIPDSALHDAAGKAEYLGKTAGWRARRLEFILKAMAEGKGTESPEMIVARAERATANLLLTKGGMHDNVQAAYDEAFGKDAGFIQKNVMPWINGDRSNVGSRWMKLVAELKTQNFTPGQGGIGTSGEVSLRPFDASHAAGGTVTTVPAGEGVVQGAAATADTFQDFAIDQQTQRMGMALLGIVGAGVWASGKGLEDKVAHDPRRNEFIGDEEHTVPETQLQGIDDVVADAAAAEAARVAAEAARVAAEAAAEAARLAGEKGPAIKAEIDAFITDADAAIGAQRTALEAVYTDVKTSSITADHIDAIIDNAGAFAEMQTKLTAGQALLAKEDGGLKYADFDTTSHSNKLHIWVATQEEVLKLVDLAKVKIKEKVEGIATAVTTTRQDGTDAPARKIALADKLTELKILDKLSALVPAVIADATWKDEVEALGLPAQAEAEQAIAVIDIEIYLSNDTKNVQPAVMKILNDHNCFDPTEPTLPKPDKAKYIVKLSEKMRIYKVGKAGLDDMGFMTTAGLKPFKPEHQTRIETVLTRLFNDEDDIFAK